MSCSPQEFTADELAAEEWRVVDGFPDYEVSNLGRARSWRGRGPCGRRSKPTLLKPIVNSYGYIKCGLYGDSGRVQLESVHKLVAHAFLGPRPPGHQVRHSPSPDPKNNRVTNLSSGTAKDNAADRALHGNTRSGTSHGSSKLSEAQIAEICASKENAAVFAAKFAVSKVTVQRHRRRNTKAAQP